MDLRRLPVAGFRSGDICATGPGDGGPLGRLACAIRSLWFFLANSLVISIAAHEVLDLQTFTPESFASRKIVMSLPQLFLQHLRGHRANLVMTLRPCRVVVECVVYIDFTPSTCSIRFVVCSMYVF